MKKILCITLACVLLLSSCNFSGKLTRRYKKIAYSHNNSFISDNVEVNAFVLDKDKATPASKSIFDLSPKAQAALIAEVSKKEAATDPFIAGLVKSLLAKTNTASEVIDYSQFDRKIVVSVRNTGHQPADRIAKINVGIDLGSTAKVKLASCSRLSTEYQNLDLGKLNYSNTQSGELGAKITGGVNSEAGIEAGGVTANVKPNLSGEINGKLNASRSFSEEVLLKQRMVALNASISENKLSLYEEGVSGIDLTGNIIADVTLGVEDLAVDKVFSFGDLLKADNSLNDAAALKVNEKLIIYPNLTSDVTATVSFSADYRYVVSGDKTISEADDKVNLYYGNYLYTRPTILIPQSKLKPKLWIISFEDVAGGLPVQIKSPVATGAGELVFNSFNDARDFANWLKAKYTAGLKVGAQQYEVTMPTGFTSLLKIIVKPYSPNP